MLTNVGELMIAKASLQSAGSQDHVSQGDRSPPTLSERPQEASRGPVEDDHSSVEARALERENPQEQTEKRVR